LRGGRGDRASIAALLASAAPAAALFEFESRFGVPRLVAPAAADKGEAAKQARGQLAKAQHKQLVKEAGKKDVESCARAVAPHHLDQETAG